MNSHSKIFRSTLSALIFIFGTFTASAVSILSISNPVNAAPTTKADCEKLGDTWIPTGPGNYAAAYCSGHASCASNGGIWNSDSRSCTSMTSSLSAKMQGMTAKERATSYAYYKVIWECVNSNLKNDNIYADIDFDGLKTKPLNGYWYGSVGKAEPDKNDYGWGIRYGNDKAFLGSVEGSCSEITETALKKWGLGDPYKMLEALNYSYDDKNSSPQWKYNGDKDGKNKAAMFKAWVEKNNIATSITSEDKYYLTLSAFKAFCQPKSLGKYESLSSGRKGQVDGYSISSGVLPALSKVTEVVDGKLVTSVYEYQFGPNDSTNTYMSLWPIFEDDSMSNSNSPLGCTSMPGIINASAAAFLNGALEDSCRAGGITVTNDIKACKAGIQFPENSEFCALVFSDASQVNKCETGQGLKLGDTGIDGPGGGVTLTDNGESSCGIEGLGWIVCPLLGFLGSISDTAFDFLSTSFLETSAGYVEVGGPAYNAWVVMRNFANVAFVIVFLIIIFSQLTGYGVSNYGVKKMLPRLVIAAILVNLSFFVCQVAVDLSNILGYSLKSLFDSIGTLVQPASEVRGDATGNGLGIAVIVTGVLVGGITLLFSITVPILLAVVLALLMIVLILLGRTAIIILLVIVSPLAFVAYLLPNTEDWFKKWYKLFFSLLLLFPIIAVVFGASGLAGKIIYDSASGDMVRQLMGVGVAAIPLFVVPSLLKGALSATGQLGAKLSGLANKAGGNVGSKYKGTSRLAAFNEARRRNAQIRRAQITGGVYNGKNPFSKASSAVSGAFNASRISGAAGTKLAQQSAALANKLDVEDIEAANAQIKQANISDADLKRVANGEAVKGINGRDGAARAAAMMEQTRRGNFGDLQSSWNGMLGESPAVKRRVAQAFSSFADRPGFIGQGVLGQLSRSEGVPAEQTLEYLAANGGDRYSAQKIASTSKEELGYLLSQQTVATATNPTGGIQGELIDAANEAFSNPDISGLIGNNRNAIMDIATNPAPRR